MALDRDFHPVPLARPFRARARNKALFSLHIQLSKTASIIIVTEVKKNRPISKNGRKRMPFTIERNDLAFMDVDAVVIAANEQLQITGGSGASVAMVAGADLLQAACDDIGFCPTGSAVATPGFNLHAKTIVHAVGPVWRGGAHDEAALLRSAYDSALACAVQEGAQSIALPLLSAGTYQFPPELSLSIAREAVRSFLNDHDIDVRLVLFSREAVAAGIAAYVDIASYIDDNYVDNAYMGRSSFVPSPYEYDEFEARRSSAPASARSSAPMPGSSSIPPVAQRGYPANRAQPPVRAKKRKSPLGRLKESLTSKRETVERAESAPSYSAPSVPLAGSAAPKYALDSDAPVNLTDVLDSLDASFSSTLLALIDARGLSDVEVYKRANMSRQLFSKIRSDESYRPAKKTALALAIALELDLNETRDLLQRAGFALSHSNKADLIVEYYIKRGEYDIYKINETLYAFDQPLLL